MSDSTWLAAAGPSFNSAARHRRLTTAGEHHPVAFGQFGEARHLIRGMALLATGQVGFANRAGQRRVPAWTARQQQQVVGVRIGGRLLGRAGPRFELVDTRWTQAQLGAKDRRQTERPRRFGEADHAVEAVVIGDRQRLETEPHRFFGQFFWRRRAVEEREVRVAVQFGVGRGGRRADRAPGAACTSPGGSTTPGCRHRWHPPDDR